MFRTKIQISPNWQIIAQIAVALMYLAASNSLKLPVGIPESVGPIIQSWANFFIGIYVCLIPLFPAFSSSKPGPLAPDDPKIVKDATARVEAIKAVANGLMLIALIWAGLSIAMPRAFAEPVKALVVAKNQTPAEFNSGTTGPSLPSTTDNLFAGLADPFKDLANFLASDFVGAAALSTSIPGLIDGNGHDCWVVMQGAGAILKQHPIPLTLHAATDLEALRLFNAEALKVCQAPQCTQVFAELTHGIQTLMPINAPVPIQISDICSKIPAVAMVAPTLPDLGVSAAPTPAKTP